MYAQLLIDLFKYLAPFLRNVELTKPMQILYKVRKLSASRCYFQPKLSESRCSGSKIGFTVCVC